MKQKIAIYLAGSIKKEHHRSNETYWTQEDISFIQNALEHCELSFLNPSLRTDDLSDPYSVFGRDMLQVFSSNFVFVDARDRRGLGVGAEMLWAKMNTIPVISWVTKNSHYDKKQINVLGVPVANFVNPFVEALSDIIVENLADGCRWIDFVRSNPAAESQGVRCVNTYEIKGMHSIGAAMQYYKDRQLQHDGPMQELLRSSEELRQRLHRSHPHVTLHS
jgi:hypothetical protein